MKSSRLLPNLYSLFILGLLPSQTIAQGKLALFSDWYCQTPTRVNPTTSLALSTCLIPIGADSIAIDLLPACDNGNKSQMVMYQDSSCARAMSPSYSGRSDGNNCYYYFGTESIPSVMFTCEDPATDPQPTSTSTVTATPGPGVATSAKGTNSQTGSAAPTTPLGSSPSSSSATTGQASSPTTGGKGASATGDSNSSSGSTGLGTSDKIALGVGLGVGVPTIVIGLLAWCLPRRGR